MPRQRLGVVLLVPPPLAIEIDALRRALGDDALTRVPPHLTLVPPVNVAERDLAAALEVLRSAAGTVRPFELALGPVTTFLPDNPTLYLAVDGDADALHALHAVRERVFRPPLERPLTWPFVAHVTLADDAPVSRIDAAVAALTSYAATMTVDRVTLLCEEGRVWRPIADAALGPAAVVGRGGLATEITASSLVDPEVRARRDSWWHVSDVERFGRALGRDPLVLVARREGAPVGLAEGWYSEGVAHLSGLIVDPVCRGEGIGARLLAAFESDGWQRGAHRLSLRTEPGSPEHGFYLRRGWRDEGVLTRWLAGHDFVQMGKRAR